MGRQTFRDESNYKHEPHAKHYIDDKFEKGTDTRNWKKNMKGGETDDNYIEMQDDQPVVPTPHKGKSVKNSKKSSPPKNTQSKLSRRSKFL